MWKHNNRNCVVSTERYQTIEQAVSNANNLMQCITPDDKIIVTYHNDDTVMCSIAVDANSEVKPFKTNGKRPTIYQIAKHVRTVDPENSFFDKQTLRFFEQRLSDFSVWAQPDGRYLIKAPSRICGETHYTIRFYNPIDGTLTLQ